MFAGAIAAHAALVAGALAVTLAAGHRDPGTRAVLIVLLACGMGTQNAAGRGLAVPDLVTNVLTTTLTGLATDPPSPATRRRLASIAAMFTGALIGAALYLNAGPAAALAMATVLLICVAWAARRI